jgi:haloalkane dehalogenase
MDSAIHEVHESAADAASFLASEVRWQDVGTAEIAYRRFGSGPPLLLVHGWPLSGLTYRHLLPFLSSQFTCYAVDLPGAGESRWRDDNDFSFGGQAENLQRFVAALELNGLHVVAHDTGATITRALALIAGERLRKLVLMGTEIPGHRPPWIPLFQQLTALPGARPVFQLLLSSAAFVRSPMAFGNCFVDRGLLAGDFHQHFVRPLVESRLRMEGQMRYLKGIDWQLVDRLASDHRRISQPVLLIWGDQDSIFPVERARAMQSQFADCRGFVTVPGKLFVHEEQPQAVAEHIRSFLTD